jgi:hypothetical protein
MWTSPYFLKEVQMVELTLVKQLSWQRMSTIHQGSQQLERARQ